MIQWYPGHMAKAKKEIQSQSKYVDIICETLDARAPRSSANPMLEDILENKKQLFILNKADLADQELIKEWLAYYGDLGFEAIAINAKKPKDIEHLKKKLKVMGRPFREKWRQKGMKQQALRLLIVGIPNVGKSTLINQLCRKKVAAIGDKPGVTRGQQWVNVDKDFILLDTPGVLWPKFSNEKIAQNLSLIGAIKDTHYHADDLCLYAMAFLDQYYPGTWQSYYKILNMDNTIAYGDQLLYLSDKMGYKDNYDQAAEHFLRDLRLGKLGKFVLDRLDEEVYDNE